MEGGGERHPGEPPRTLGLFVPKQSKENALARHNTTQAHKERMLPKNRHISHPMPEYPPPGLGLFLTNWGDEEYRKTRRYLLFPPCQQ
ncbi:hypothetical protein D7X98_19055 [bacterium 1XD8-76]|nr:hypothetical protein D7X98_19055 [bacterium 1XD8-76]